jgi:hypothetical protein
MDSGIVYVVFNKWIRNPETNEMPYKIGITSCLVEDRYYGLGLKMPGEFEIFFAYKLDDYKKAEKVIHDTFNKKCVNGEWFNINQKDIEHIKATFEIMGGEFVTDEVKKEIETETENNLISGECGFDAGKLSFEFIPNDEETFKQELLKTKKAKRTLYYRDGRTKTEEWQARKFEKTSDLRQNIKTNNKVREWKKNGLIKVKFEILY